MHPASFMEHPYLLFKDAYKLCRGRDRLAFMQYFVHYLILRMQRNVLPRAVIHTHVVAVKLWHWSSIAVKDHLYTAAGNVH